MNLHTLAQASTDSQLLAVTATALVIAVLCVFIHFETLQLIMKILSRWKPHARVGLLMAVLVMLLAHLLEIFLYAGAYSALMAWDSDGSGQLVGTYSPGMRDTFYFSAAVYTTVGFGDIIPVGPLRLLVATEALVGLVMITWSASFSFLAMQHYWKELNSDEQAEK